MKYSAQIRMASAAALALAMAPAALAQGLYPKQEQMEPRVQNSRPQILTEVKVEQRLGEQVPLDLRFRDELGREVQLGDYFRRGKAVLLTPVYYECPMLCNQVLNGTTAALSTLSFDVGREFEVITFSFDPSETPEMAAAKKKSYLRRYKREGAGRGWHFLTGDQASIDALTDAIGFRYRWDENSKQWAHGSAIMVLTPEGKLAQYFYGIEYSGRDLRLALVESSRERIGSVVDQLMLYCYHYDPATGKYGAVVMNMIRAGGAATVLVLGTFLVVMIRRERRQAPARRAG